MELAEIPMKVFFPNPGFLGFFIAFSAIHTVVQYGIFESSNSCYYKCQYKSTAFKKCMRNIYIGAPIIFVLCYLGGVYREIYLVVH